MIETTENQSAWVEHFNARKAKWARGQFNHPLGGTFRRCEIPESSWPGGELHPSVRIMLAAFGEPNFEIIYDKFTVVGGCNGSGPGFHLVTVRHRGATPKDDILSFEVSLQKKLLQDQNFMWPQGSPVAPTPEFMAAWLPMLKLHDRGPMWKNPLMAKKVSDERKERRNELTYQQRKKTFELDVAIADEFIPRLDGGRCDGAVGKTFNSYAGKGIPCFEPSKKVISSGALK